MLLLDCNGQVIDQSWTVISGDEPLPSHGDIIVPSNRLPSKHKGRLGVNLPNDMPGDLLQSVSCKVDLIILNFPSFSDGRAYSQARLLREHHGFRGELRATGDLLPDQFAFMLEVGFDSFELLTDRFAMSRWSQALQASTLTYHRHLARGEQTAISAARHGR